MIGNEASYNKEIMPVCPTDFVVVVVTRAVSSETFLKKVQGVSFVSLETRQN